jgi:5-methylcytosine-specific restriction endonuclease McrA
MRATAVPLIESNRWAWSRLRKTILIRDRWTCQLCGAPANSVDHIIPRARGGGDDPSNLRAVDWNCQSPDRRTTIVPFPTPALTPTRAERALTARIRPITGELSVGRPRNDLEER